MHVVAPHVRGAEVVEGANGVTSPGAGGVEPNVLGDTSVLERETGRRGEFALERSGMMRETRLEIGRRFAHSGRSSCA